MMLAEEALRTTVSDRRRAAEKARLNGTNERSALLRDGSRNLIRVESVRRLRVGGRRGRLGCAATNGRGRVILVDTSIWIGHLHAAERRLTSLLGADEVGCHGHVIEGLALGTLKRREQVLSLMSGLWRFPALAHDEVLALVEGSRLWGRGLSAIDVHLLGSTAIVGGARPGRETSGCGPRAGRPTSP